MYKLNPEYIIGLVDGEGSFTVHIRNIAKSGSIKRRARIEPRFYIKLAERDKEILYALKEYFGCGSVYFQKDSRPNHQNCYRYEVFNRTELNSVIIPFFKQNLLRFPSKQKDFNMFCTIMNSINKDEHLSNIGLRKLLHIKQHMH